MDEHAFHRRRYSRQELVGKVRPAGFHVIRTTSFVSLLLPLLLLSRFKRHNTRANFNSMAEFDINERLNTSLEKTLDFERALIEKGVSFPAGGTLLLIAIREPE